MSEENGRRKWRVKGNNEWESEMGKGDVKRGGGWRERVTWRRGRERGRGMDGGKEGRR